MILTDYYKFERLENQKSKTRIDCTASTESYNSFEELKNKKEELFVYMGDNTYTKAGADRKADLALSRTKHISSVYVPDVNKPLGYGDVKGTADAILFILHNYQLVDGVIQAGAVVEVFIARGQRHNRASLFNILDDGELDEEMANLRNQVKQAPER